MKRTIGILIIATAALCACGNKNSSPLSSVQEAQQNSTLSYVDETEKLNNVLQTYDKPMQRFQTTSKKSSTVTGELGTVIHVNPANLETFDGQPLGEKIDIELKEYCTQVDLLRSNTATVSNGQLLVSGGAYYLNMSSDSKPLRIKEGKNLEVEFLKFSDEEMELFYGQRDSLGQMNWQVAQQRFKGQDAAKTDATGTNTTDEEIDAITSVVIFETAYKIDTVEATGFSQEELEVLKKQRKKEIKLREKEQKYYNTTYQAITINQLGWINCDRFFKISNKTQLLIAFNELANIRIVSLFLVFKDINSVMQCFYYPIDYAKTTSVEDRFAAFTDIPVGYNVRLIAYAFDEKGKTYTYSSDLTIKKDEKLSINLQKSSSDDLEQLFACKW